MKRVLIVDDDAGMRQVLQILVRKLDMEPVVANGADAALAVFREQRCDLVTTDLRMPRKDGIEFLHELRRIDAEVPVIVLTAHGTVETAVEAMKLGAVDYFQKPFDNEALAMVMRRALENSRVRTENRFLRETSQPVGEASEIVGGAPAMQPVFEMIRRVAAANSSVLITGETGTGKELAARAIHNNSTRRDKLFVALNCTAIPSELLESELFGHVKGAFSGATADRIGKFQAADEGTLFLDEIGDMDVRLQAKLLRVLQEGEIEPVGGNRRVSVDVRIISSTHRDLAAAMKEGNFREDLFFRLNVIELKMPALRERPQDIALLAATFLARSARDLKRPAPRLDAGAAALLERYSWPGNVRELRNLMERAVVLSRGEAIDEGLIRSFLPQDGQAAMSGMGLEPALDELEKRLIEEALAATGDNKAEAARRLGIGERTLWTKLKKHGI